MNNKGSIQLSCCFLKLQKVSYILNNPITIEKRMSSYCRSLTDIPGLFVHLFILKTEFISFEETY